MPVTGRQAGDNAGNHAMGAGDAFLSQFGGGAVIWFEWNDKKPHSFARLEGIGDNDLPIVAGALAYNLNRLITAYAQQCGVSEEVFVAKVAVAAAMWEATGSDNYHQVVLKVDK